MVREHIDEQHGIVVKVENSEVTFNHSESVNCEKILEWLGGKGYKNIILPMRTEDEINHPQQVPHDNVINELRYKYKKKLYFFIQDPWPDPINPVNMDEDTFVLRFTYDEGNEMDRTWREWETEDGYYMLTRDEIVKL